MSQIEWRINAAERKFATQVDTSDVAAVDEVSVPQPSRYERILMDRAAAAGLLPGPSVASVRFVLDDAWKDVFPIDVSREEADLLKAVELDRSGVELAITAGWLMATVALRRRGHDVPVAVEDMPTLDDLYDSCVAETYSQDQAITLFMAWVAMLVVDPDSERTPVGIRKRMLDYPHRLPADAPTWTTDAILDEWTRLISKATPAASAL
jgi:hypothetical protein